MRDGCYGSEVEEKKNKRKKRKVVEFIEDVNRKSASK
jgi:hypothetical protein